MLRPSNGCKRARTGTSRLFVEATNDTHPAVRQAAILGLGRLGDDRALDALLSLVQTADGKHQHAAVGAVAQLQNQTSLPNLYPLTRSEDPLMRQYSVRALGWMPNSASIPLLKERSQDPEEKVRMEALLALTRFEGLPTADALLAFMNDELVYIRSEAARLMGKSPGEGSLLHSSRHFKTATHLFESMPPRAFPPSARSAQSEP